MYRIIQQKSILIIQYINHMLCMLEELLVAVMIIAGEVKLRTVGFCHHAMRVVLYGQYGEP